MYVPHQFREERRDVLVAAMRDIQLAAIVTQDADGPCATHAPVVVREEENELLLEFHVARQNPHWRRAGQKSLVIFQGPHAYIHPGWYAGKAEHGRVVPTWTYVMVHAHGTLEAMESDAELLAHLGQLTDRNEAEREQPWAVSDAPEKYIQGMARAIVGLRMRVDSLEGSWKLNQHKSGADRAGVQSGLSNETDPDAQAISALMRGLENGPAPAARKA